MLHVKKWYEGDLLSSNASSVIRDITKVAQILAGVAYRLGTQSSTAKNNEPGGIKTDVSINIVDGLSDSDHRFRQAFYADLHVHTVDELN